MCVTLILFCDFYKFVVIILICSIVQVSLLNTININMLLYSGLPCVTRFYGINVIVDFFLT